MALTYTATVFNTAGTASPGNGSYKDVTDAGVANGDLLVCLSAGEGYTFSGGTRSISTTAGSTGSWTTYYPTPTLNNDTEVTAAWATASSTASVTARPVIRTTTGAAGWTGAALVRIPAAEWTGTPSGVAAFQADADGQASVTLAAGTWTVIYIGSDWTGGSPGTTNTPAGSTNQTSFTDGSHYSVAIRTWTGQAAGTRSYGPTGLTSRDFTGVVIAVQEAGGGGTNAGTLTASLPRVTASITGASTNAGTLSASPPRATATLTGSSTNAGTLSASLPKATSTITGTSTNAGTLSASVPRVTASITGASTNAGTLSAALPKATATITGQSTNPGTLSASLPRVTASIADTATNVGTLNASLPKVTGSIAGSSINAGTLAASLPKVTGSVAGTSTLTGTVAASLPPLTGQLTGSSTNPGTLVAALPILRAALGESASMTHAPAARTLVVEASDRSKILAASDRTSTPWPSARTRAIAASDRTRLIASSDHARIVPALGGQP